MSNNRKTLSWELRAFHRHAIQKLLDAMQDGEWHFTHSLSYSSSSFTGRANRPLLRQCLRTLESEGTVECKQFTKTSHEWRLKPKETEPTCSCPNQFLLPDGAKCEICEGIVQAVQSIASTTTQQDIWDEFYFEELETFYEDIEFTA